MLCHFPSFFLSDVVKRSFYKIQWLIPKNCMQNSNWVVQLKNAKCRNTTVFTLAAFLPIYLIYTTGMLYMSNSNCNLPAGEMKENACLPWNWLLLSKTSPWSDKFSNLFFNSNFLAFSYLHLHKEENNFSCTSLSVS